MPEDVVPRHVPDWLSPANCLCAGKWRHLLWQPHNKGVSSCLPPLLAKLVTEAEVLVLLLHSVLPAHSLCLHALPQYVSGHKLQAVHDADHQAFCVGKEP